jgi:hypothetical protein
MLVATSNYGDTGMRARSWRGVSRTRRFRGSESCHNVRGTQDVLRGRGEG